MKAQDLMIGNYLKWKDNGSIFEITIDLLCDKDFHNHLSKGDFEPIILSEDILLKCGFEKKKHLYDRYILNDFELERQGVNYAYVLWGGEDAPHLTQFIGHCKHLHELQQLY